MGIIRVRHRTSNMTTQHKIPRAVSIYHEGMSLLIVQASMSKMNAKSRFFRNTYGSREHVAACIRQEAPRSDTPMMQVLN